MKPKIIILLIAFAVILSSCSKMPVYQSKESNTSDRDEFPAIATDQNSKNNEIIYGVADNDTLIYFKAVFHDQQSLVKILRGGGLNIYFDSTGKKKKKYQLKIERSQEQSVAANNLRQQYGSSRENMRQNMPSVIGVMLDKVTWNADGKEYIFNRNLIDDPIRIELDPNELNELVLKLKIPIEELDLPKDQNHFSMGIETNTISQEMGNRPSGGMNGGRSGGSMSRSGGGQRSGGQRGSGGGSGGQGGRPPGSSGSSQSSTSPIKIWFQVEL